MTEEEIRERVKAALSPQRFRHVEGVVEAAGALAIQHGADPVRARTAAWIHDVAREWPAEKLRSEAERIEVPSGFAMVPVLLHGPIAAHLMREEFGIEDKEMADAVRYHTTGRPGMSMLEKILYLADAIEPGRTYPGVDELRSIAARDLDLAVARAMDAGIEYLLRRHEPIFPLTVLARNELWELINRRG
ncbi:MAG: bis(5'-nucleosyl)-tetraphosphatase (symmetrical) YqeK [Thermoflavifilum sp.]|nr:bis(5'-nucleosyl)-tetraphosphatase (symmetrical) YqeK [Thermoflavifilum sp.]MCL6512920.1 bis(5'-nucleosyl)-tetraphosphatase (symmetrical) YqeK [Alicyclobacillus sp.]